MDQQAFRQLLSTPRIDDARQSAGSSSTPRYFGKPNKRVTKESESELLPRKVGKAGKKGDGGSASKTKAAATNSATGEVYVDRAEARRLGKEDDDEFKDVEMLRADFEQRISEAADEEEREKLREQMNFLGGDAKHSVLVKGLDYALLAQEKAKMNGRGEEDDEDLEGAYGSGAARPSESVEKRQETKVASKFRPIGSSAGIKPIEKAEEGAEFIWRNGKRMRKKKKKPVEEQGEEKAAAAKPRGKEVDKGESSVQAARRKDSDTKGEMPPPRSLPAKNVAPIELEAVKDEQGDPLSDVQTGTAGAAAEGASKADEEEGARADESSGDESVDIFAGAGRWKGLEDDESDEESEEGSEGRAERAEQTPAAAPAAPAKRDWFSTGREKEAEREEKSESRPLPSNLSTILDSAQAKPPPAAAGQAGQGSSEEEEDDEEEEEEAKPERLQGFSDSILGREGVRYMLEKKDDDRGDRKRKRKRSKKGKGGYGSD